jgi:MYXO-CTERM domain-containing protein
MRRLPTAARRAAIVHHLAAIAASALAAHGCGPAPDLDAARSAAAAGTATATTPSRRLPAVPPPHGEGARRACTSGASGPSCSAAAAPARFVPGRLVVKFREGFSEPADVVHASGLRFADVAPAGGADLDRLVAEHRVRSVTPLFSSFFPAAPKQARKAAGAERRKRFLEAVSRARAASPHRARRAPSDAPVPDLTRVYVLEVDPDTDIFRLAQAWAANPAVEYAGPDHLAVADALPDDPYLGSSGAWGQPFADLWALHRIGAPAAWASPGNPTGDGVVVAVVDTGLDRNHPDIAANEWRNDPELAGTPGVDDDGNGFVDDVRGWDFAYGDADPMDGNGHGTHVSGTIAAAGDNALGVVGVAYQARIMALKGLDDSGYGAFTGLATAITYAARNGAEVINNSWGCTGTGCSDAGVRDALALARSLGVVVVFAAGNEGADVRMTFPANVTDVLTVSATGVDDAPGSFTNWGYLVDVAAPGGGPDGTSPYEAHRNILSLRAASTGDPSLVVSTSYLRQAGTSMAAPHVAGVAALLLSANSGLQVREVESIIRHSATDLVGDPAIDGPGHDLYYGWGLLDAAAAVALAGAPPPDPPVLKVVAQPLSFVMPGQTCSGSWSLPLDVYDLGGAGMSWTSSAPPWLTVTPWLGTSGAFLSATVYTVATRSGTLGIDAPTAIDGHFEAPVTQHVVEGVRIRDCEVFSRPWADQQWEAHLQDLGFTAPPGIADGAGGAIYIWGDTRNANPDLYMQRVGPGGESLWGEDGLPLTSAAGGEVTPAFISDGAGGAIVAYTEGGNTGYRTDKHIRAQRIDASGAKLWGPSGVWLSQAVRGQRRPEIASDGAGGAIVVWEDYRNAGYSDVYAQRVSASGTVAWQANGVPVVMAAGDQTVPVLAEDGAGGAIVAWEDRRAAGGYPSIYAQRIGPSGAASWPANGIPIAQPVPPSRFGAWGPDIVPDGAGGAIIAWIDLRNLATGPGGVTWLDRGEIYAARVDASGTRPWATNGVPVMEGPTAATAAYWPGWLPAQVAMTPDGRGGLFFVWHDARNEVSWDLYAQRFDVDGNRLWGTKGVPVTTEPHTQISPQVISDGRDGALFVWSDQRAGNYDVFLQRLGPDGEPLMPPGGAWIESTPGDQELPNIVALARRRFLVTYDDYVRGWYDFVGKLLEFNDPPVALPQSVAAEEDGPAGVTLAGADADGDPLTYTVVSAPSHGALSGTAPALTYTPAADFAGSDAFTFKVNDGTVDSAAATVSITVTPVNDAPVASAHWVGTAEDTAVAVTLSGSDVDGDALSYEVVGGPSHGALSGTPPALTYTPAADFAGADAFTFEVNDGTVDSAAATVSITVTAVNDAPVASAQSVAATEDTPVAVTLAGSDPETEALAFAVVEGPAHGTLSGTAPALTYTPAADFAGADAFTFEVNDGTVDSAAATVSITVAAVNDLAVASAQWVAATEDTPVAVTLSGSDVDGDPLTYALLTGPSHGTLSGAPPALGYAPDADWAGEDTFTFRVNDGTADSAPATVTVAVAAVNDAPVAAAQALDTQEGAALPVTLSGADLEGDPLSYRVVSEPSHGTLSGAPPALTYAPAPGYSGDDAFDFVANDGVEDSAPATVRVVVRARPPDEPSGGCGCSTGADAAPLALILLGLTLRRRRS